MHKMHEVARGKRKEPASGQPKKQQQQKQKEPKRTGLDEEQQRRIAARAAKAMEKQVRRRRDRRSQFVWGDRKKAVIKRYPDGTQEILVPQNLTPEQEHYEFPPRSRLLKKLASATAERRRMSFLQQPDSDTTDPPNPLLPPPTILPSAPLTPPKPDQSAMDEWFSSRKPDNSKHQQQKERQVIDWIRDIENSKTPKKRPITSSSSSSSAPKKQQQPPATRSPLLLFDHAPIQFKSKAGKRWAQSSGYAQSPSSPLAPPPEEDSARRHYVPRNLLRRAGARPKEQDDAATRIQATWRGHNCRHHQSNVTGMVKLVGMFHKALEQQQRLAQERLQQLESLLQEERRQRERSEQKHQSSWNRLEELQAKLDKHPDMNSLLKRVSALENSVSKESLARAQLENSVSAAMQYMNTLDTPANKNDKARAESLGKRRPRSVATTTTTTTTSRVSRQPQ